MEQHPEVGDRQGWGVRETVVSVVMAAMVVTSVILVRHVLYPPTEVSLDTRFQSGGHLTFVMIGPTSVPSDDYPEAVRKAKDAVRELARDSSFGFSTIGVSVEWYVNQGLEILERFGPFDELIVGRNLLNTGFQKYVTQVDAPAGVPQVILTFQEIDVGHSPIRYGETQEIARFVGQGSLNRWAESGFKLQFSRGADLGGNVGMDFDGRSAPDGGRS